MSLTDQQIETLAFSWPWEYERVERALRIADAAGWPLDDTVRGLDAIADNFGDDSDPVDVVEWALAWRQEHDEDPIRAYRDRFQGPA